MENNFNEQNAQTQVVESKQKKAWYKKWWSILIMVIVGIKIITALFGGSGSDKTSTTPVATKSPQATVEPNKSSSEKPTANKSTEAKSNVSNERSPAFLYEALQKTETTPFTLTEKAKVFLKENPSLFSTNVTAIPFCLQTAIV